MTTRLEFGAEVFVIFHHPVVNQRQLARGVAVRVRVFERHPAMRRPARVADAGRSRERMVFDFLNERRDMPDRLANFDFSTIQHSRAGRIVTPVFQTAEPLQQEGHGVGIPHITNDSAHDQLSVPLRGVNS